MSDVVERTLSALPGWLGQQPPPSSPERVAAPAPAPAPAPSRLGGLIRSITALASKHEEEKLIQQELNNLRATVSGPATTLRLMKECMVRLIYCEMLGYEAPFGYIHAIKLAQQGNLLEKRVGYLAVSLFLHENHELLLLLVNTVVKDLQSTNLMEVCMALTATSQLFPQEMIPAVLPLIEDKLQHSKEIIRRKAVQALHRFSSIAPNQVQHIHDKFRKALCDRDVGVMAASLHIYLQMVKENSSRYKDLTGSFVAILKQVVGGKLPVDFNYHSVPAPWLQMQLLRILALLGKNDPRTSELMYDVLDESLRRAEINHNITYAILFECVQTIYTIFPNSDLLEKAAKCVGKFVLSSKINLKYLGLKTLTYVVQQDPARALQHQMTIIECLDHPDPMIKRETLQLLYRITNGQNVTVVVQKMLEYLHQSKDEYTLIDIVGKIAELSEKYAPDHEWFIQTMNAVFSVGGDKMHPDIPNTFLRLLAEGFGEEKEDRQLRLQAAHCYLVLLQDQKAVYPQKFLQVMCWVLGEYTYLMENVDPDVVLASLYRIHRSNATCETQAWIMAAATKIAAHTSDSKPVAKLIQACSASLDTCGRQYAFELKHLCEDKELMRRLFPAAARGEDVVVDASLSFLDGFVAEGLHQGAAPYKPPHQRQEEKRSREKALNFDLYGQVLSQSYSVSAFAGRQSPSGLSLGSDVSGNSADTGQKEIHSLKLEGVKKLWGKEGYLPPKESQLEKEEIRKAVLQGNPSVDHGIGNPPSESEQEITGLPEGEKEKQQLASTLFVGLGSQGSISLMGKGESPSQEFKRTSQRSESVSLRSVASPPSSICPDALARHEELVQKDSRHLRRRTALRSSLLEAQEGLGSSPPPPEAAFFKEQLWGHSVSDGNLDTFQPPLRAQSIDNKLLFLTPSLPEELAKHPHSEILDLCGNEALMLYSCKVWQDDCTLLCLFVANKSTCGLKAVSVEFKHTEHFKLVENLACHFAVIDAARIESFQRQVEMAIICSEGLLSGSIGYHLESDILLGFSVPLTLLDFIRPMKMSTDEFGKLWLSCSNDAKQNLKISPSQGSLLVVLNILQQKLKLHIVDIIGHCSTVNRADCSCSRCLQSLS